MLDALFKVYETFKAYETFKDLQKDKKDKDVTITVLSVWPMGNRQAFPQGPECDLFGAQRVCHLLREGVTEITSRHTAQKHLW